MIQNDTKEMKKEKQQNMRTAEAGAHDLFVVLTVEEGGQFSMETLERGM